jgi:hypothetical protein
LKNLHSNKHALQKDLKELENSLHTQYEEMAFNVQTEKAKLEMHYQELTATANQEGEILLREITAIVNQRKAQIAEMKNKHLIILDKHRDEIAQRITEIKQAMMDIKHTLDTDDIFKISTYKSKNVELNALPPKVQVTLPSLSPRKIDREKLHEMFGSLSSKSPLLVEPQLKETIHTGYEDLFSVSCLSDDQLWARGNSRIIELLDCQGERLKSIQTDSGNWPQDIEVTQDGNLLYTDPDKRSVNLVKSKHIQTVITQQGWIPRKVCSSSTGELLVIMARDDYRQCKVSRYFGSTEIQTIQFDDQGRPLYSSGRNTKCICENRNLDICVADRAAKAVVVVKQLGKLHFSYNGNFSIDKRLFDPVGITTDSQSHILITDCNNNRIHILEQNGLFLCYIDNCHLCGPFGLCVDTRDNLFVAELDTSKVKKIQYL